MKHTSTSIKSITLASLLLVSVAPQAAHGDINMMEASFTTSFIDAQIGESKSPLKLTRSYDSRSTYSGLFGFGWCSNLDATLEKNKNSFTVTTCGKSEEAKVSADRATYTRTLNDGTKQRFSEDGELIGLKSPGHKEVKILRVRTSLPQKAAAEEGKTGLRLELDNFGRVLKLTNKEVTGKVDREALFTYSPDGNLITAKNAWSNTYTFQYDRLHNLTLVRYPDQSFERLTYDVDYDRVLSFEGRSQKNAASCKETYSYLLENQTPEDEVTHVRTQTSISRLTCDNKLVKEVKFDFHFSKRTDRKWALSRLLLTREGKTQTLNYRLGGLQ